MIPVSRESPSPNSVILSRLSSPMDIKASSSNKESSLEGNPFAASTIADPLCKLHLKETSEFVKALPAASTENRRRSMEAPSTPDKPLLSFTAGNLSRKSIPSKWDDAEKWVASGSCNESPAHLTKFPDSLKILRSDGVVHQKGDAFAEKVKPRRFQGSDTALHVFSSEVLLQDNVELPSPCLRFSDPTEERFLFGGTFCEPVEAATIEVASPMQHRDIGTEMIPAGSLATSRCYTPIKCSSPARHNTPADRSGPLVATNTTLDISELKDCHFAKLKLSAQYDLMLSNWSSREEEEADVSKSLRHSDTGGGRKSFTETRASLWENEERTKICIRYQREEARIQAWINLQSAKAEAQTRKLEVKIQKMRSNLEEKMMRRMAIVQRRAEEWRAASQLQHSQQILRASEQAQKMRIQQSSPVSCSCGCFPCKNYI